MSVLVFVTRVCPSCLTLVFVARGLSLAGCPSALPRTFVTFVTPAVPTGARQRRSPIILSSSIVVVGIIIIISTTNTITSSSSSMRTVCTGTRLLRARTDRRRVDSCR